MTSCRTTMVSEPLDAWLRLSKTSQPNTRTMIKCSRRTRNAILPDLPTAPNSSSEPAPSSEAVQALYSLNRLEVGNSYSMASIRLI